MLMIVQRYNKGWLILPCTGQEYWVAFFVPF